MKTLSFIRCSFLGFAVCIFLASTCRAQTQNCSLHLSVRDSASQSEFFDVNVSAFNTETKKVFKAQFENKSYGLVFDSVDEGTYRITVTKPYYKKSVQIYEHKCSVERETLWILLYRGSPKSSVVRASKDAIIYRIAVTTVSADPNENSSAPAPPVVVKKEANKSVPKIINQGSVNGKAINLIRPEYPSPDLNINDTVIVQVIIDEDGKVESAKVLSGHPLLRAAALKAAKETRFSMTQYSGVPVKVQGTLSYYFVAPKK